MKFKKAKSVGIIFLIVFSSFFATFIGLISSDIIASDPNKEPVNDSIDLGTLANWVSPVEISMGSDRDTRYPEIAVDEEGNIHFVWEDYSNRFDSDYNWDIFYRRWDATTASFTPVIDVSTVTTADAYQPAITVDSEGNAHVVWHDYTNVFGAGSNYDIFYRMWNKTTDTWSGHVNTYDLVTSGAAHSSSCYYSDIAADPQGNVHVVWADYNDILESSGFVDVYYKNWNATTGNWGPLGVVSTNSTQGATYPSIATDSQGNVHVAWDDRSDYFNESELNNDVVYKFWNSTTGLWSNTELVSNETYNYAYEPSIAVDGLGNVHVAWHDTSVIYGAGTDIDIFYRMKNAATQVWSGHENNIDVISERGGSYTSRYASIGANAFGNAYVAWEEYYFDGYSNYDAIHRMWNASAGSWDSMVKVSTSAGSSDEVWRPAIAVDAGGSSYVVWNEEASWDEIWFSKSIGSAPLAPILDPIFPNPNPNLDNILTWTRPMEPAQFYVYRNASYFTSVDGLTPIAVVSTNSYADVITANGTYYYAIVAENEIGNSSLSNCEGVNVSSIYGFHRLRIAQNADFPKYNFTGNGTQGNPWLIENWYINAFGGNGIHISDTTDYFIAQNNTIFGGNYGIFLRNVMNGRLINNTVYSNENGINLTSSSGNILINNTVYDNTNPSGTSVGIALTYSDGNWFEDNNVYGNDGAAVYGGLGFWLYTSDSNTLLNNHIHHNLGTGVLFTQLSNFNNLTGNQIYSNSGTIGYDRTGIAFENSGGNNNYFIKNNIYDHSIAGFYSSHAGVPNFFYNNTFHDNAVAMDTVISNAAGWEFNFNKFYNNGQAGDLWMGGASFYKNEIWNNTNGISFWGSGGTTLTNNTFWNNTNYGLAAGANNMELYNNIAYDNGAGFYCSDPNIIADGNSAYNNTGYGFLISDNTQFTNNYAIGNDIGVYITWAGFAYLDSNTLIDNREGIHIINDENSTITNNDILNNSEYGIYCENSNHSVFTWNTILNGTEGVYLLNNLNSTVQYNEIYNFSQVGIKLENTNNSLISWNLLFNNGKPLEEINCVNNTIGINPSEPGPVLKPIVPPAIDDGHVHLSWQSLSWATYYQVFRRFFFTIDEFWDIIFQAPRFNVTTTDVWDTQFSTTGLYYYVVVAANATAWSTISNTEMANITGRYGIPGTPALDSISPNPDFNGIIDLNWPDVQNATDYYIYRDTSVITNISGLTAIAKVTDSNYTDTVVLDDTYYYVIMGSNIEHNGSISNCESVDVIISPLPETPTLSPIIPSIDYDGFIYLDWTDAGNATHYYVYRDVAPIITLAGLDPIGSTLESNFTDINFVDGVYHYAVTAANLGWNSSPSNSENVTIFKQYPVGFTIMNSISPSTDTDGIIQLTWQVAENASWYYVYKDTAFIASVASLNPIATVTGLNYTDYAPINGSFHYAIVGGNYLFNSTGFTSEPVTVAIPARTTTGWTIPFILSTDSKNSSSSPTMAMDAEGNLFVVWADASTLYGSGGDVDIFCRIWNASTRTWGGVMVVSTESTSDSTAPTVAIDALGNFYVAWADASDWNGSGTDGDIFYKIYNVTTEAWSQMVVATTESGSLSSEPGIAVDDSGNIHIVWSEFNGTQTNIYATFWNTTSSSWIGNATVSSEIVGDSQNPQIGVDANYNVHIVWDAASSSLSSGADDDIFYRMANISGQYWSGIELVSTQSLLDSNYPTMTVEGDGTVHVAWHDLTPYAGSGGDHDIFYKNRDIVTGFWLGFDNSTDVVSSGSDGSSIYPRITIDENSVVHVVWVDYSDLFGAGTDADIFYKFWNSSNLTWQGYINTTGIVTVASSEDAFSATIAVTLNQQGTIAREVHVVWQDQTDFGFGADWDVYYKSFLDIYPIPDTPYLNPITPAIDYDGVIFLNWTVCTNVSRYYLYRDVSNITDVGSLVPIAITGASTDYTDILSIDGTYYYVVVAGNIRFNSSLSNCESVTFIKMYPVSTPTFDPIVPNPDNDGIIVLNWTSAENATVYYLYRDTSVITDVGALLPIATVNQTNYTDVHFIDGIYHYVVVAGNPGYNSSLSNCENVTVEIYYPVGTQVLNPIVPNPDFDGEIFLSWSTAANATYYSIYRNTSEITNVTGFTPIAVVSQLNYTDVLYTSGTYFYAVLGANLIYNGTLSNCQNVTVDKYWPVGTPSLNYIWPELNYYGNVSLSWSASQNASWYYIYRELSNITDVSGLTPLSVTFLTNYTDQIDISNTYFYVIVGGNLGFNSSISNCDNVTVERYWPVATPVLSSILPNPDFDGEIFIDWGDAENATFYYVYRNTSVINTINGLIPQAVVTQSNYTDAIFVNATFYYVVIASNPAYNSSISNCKNVTIIKYWSVGTPILDPISPSLNYEGIIHLNWSVADNASHYYVYRDTSIINTVLGLTPHATIVAQTNYTDVEFTDGTYYYVVVAGNLGYNSTISNSRNVTVLKQYPVGFSLIDPISPRTDTDGVVHLTWLPA
ncbi:MAG: right-handed parallel beta-helix repeat-containing protein, partial [Candidatus Helarchaeota archaeon]|nr:right-handed parallel beta-helix repeat-containing protein [Candidatus Helarchaeota archaeon]